MDAERPESNSRTAEPLSSIRAEVARAWTTALMDGGEGLAAHPRDGDQPHRLFDALLDLSVGKHPPRGEAEALARAHGRACGRLPAHSAAQLFAEFRLLRTLLGEQAVALGIDTSRVHGVIDDAIEAALTGFADARAAAIPDEGVVARRLAELDAIIEAAPEAIYVGTFEGVVRCNRPALEMLGFESMDQLRQQLPHLQDVVQNRDPETGAVLPVDELPFAQALQGRMSIRDTEVQHLRTGDRRIIRGRAAPIRVGEAVVGAVAINSDITEERRREEDLAEAVRLRDELLSMVSHELRSPLAALLLELELTGRSLKRTPVPAGPAEALTRGITRSTTLAKRMAQMLDRLLDLSRIRTDRFGLEIATVDLCALTHEMVTRFQPDAEAAGSSLTFDRCQQELFAYVDPVRVEQVLTNLITNAIKYGSGKPIEVSLAVEGEVATLEVRDHGIGVTDEDQRRIFDRYVRATRAHRSDSLGLGLYITREIVRAHGGTIEVLSREGEGSTFRVTLPTKRMT